MQRCPAVPIAAKATARRVRSRSAEGVTIEALLPPSSRIARAKRRASRSPTMRPMRVEPVAETTGTLGIVDQSLADLAPADQTASRDRPAPSPNFAAARRNSAWVASARQRRLLRWLPDDAVAADEREGGVPRPDGDGEIERGDDADDADRAPVLGQPMVGPFRLDRQAIELARKSNREIADVDHLLDLAQALRSDLADFERDQPAERGLVSAQFLAEQAHEFASARRGHAAPFQKAALFARPMARGASRGRRLDDASDRRAVDRRFDLERRRPQTARGTPSEISNSRASMAMADLAFASIIAMSRYYLLAPRAFEIAPAKAANSAPIAYDPARAVRKFADDNAGPRRRPPRALAEFRPDEGDHGRGDLAAGRAEAGLAATRDCAPGQNGRGEPGYKAEGRLQIRAGSVFTGPIPPRSANGHWG